ncbi:helix-turn-helix domain-containing protein [Streptomyces hawaiiensis]|uniref:XRE family transcriptional regulator n=1 Tax=Streptomyces hawaiiensis TaxID=67305 RepID=A0A6G5RK35_9ACTN|nr:helix-turn-helix transcriptional regulator [Streptomyces hawaiiensis]QCD58518.1 XRE family transcriptional regulator [Streptomyces hawaiiensis]
MTAKLDYTWRLREIMAEQGMFTTAALQPLLAERGVTLSTSQVYRLVTEKPERLSLKVLMALLDIFGCPMDDLIKPTASARATRSKRTADGTEAGIGTLRPPRARITGPEK